MKAKILSLKPTQFAVGMDEVAMRVKQMRKMTPKKLHDYLHSHKVPVILGPEGMYLVDRHHLIRACWELGLTHVPVIVKADLRHEKVQFWHTMWENKWVYLVNQFGREWLRPEDLPKSVRCMADNPWRSLAWKVRLKGGFVKDTTPFSEFRWAELFRSKLKSSDDVAGALKLCKSKAAKPLHGVKK